MFNILLIDDEPAMVDGLCKVIEESVRTSLNVYKAYSAKDAIEFLKKIRIDIVLTDICMPGMSGIELSDLILNLWPRCKVIFLTGYSDISYAQKAIRNHCEDYILKTEEDGIILRSIEKVIKKIKDEEYNLNLIQLAKDKMVSEQPLWRKEFLIELLNGNFLTQTEIENQFGNLKINLDCKCPVLILIGQVDEWEHRLDKNEVYYKIQGIFDAYLKTYVNMETILYHRDKIVLFLQPNHIFGIQGPEQYGNAPWDQTILFVQENLDVIQELCVKLLRISISFVISSEQCEWDRVGHKFKYLESLLDGRYNMGKRSVLSEQHITKFSDIGNKDADDNNGKITNKIISCIQEHIQNNLNEDLSIIRLSELVHLNPSYLSRLYKKETGDSITDYIAERKLDMAKKLLMQDQYKISDIVEKLGFSTHAYFTRFFKNKTGMPPQEYKKTFLF